MAAEDVPRNAPARAVPNDLPSTRDELVLIFCLALFVIVIAALCSRQSGRTYGSRGSGGLYWGGWRAAASGGAAAVFRAVGAVFRAVGHPAVGRKLASRLVDHRRRGRSRTWHFKCC